MAGASSLGLLVSLTMLGVYGYAAYYILYNDNVKGMKKIIPEPLHKYGQLKFLTFQCLCIQVLNALLHLGACFLDGLKGPRDFVFAALAYPVGSIVCYTFWAVWFLLGREFIFPAALDLYYPAWLNHATHTVIAPVNILFAILIPHKYPRHGMAFNLLYMAAYIGLLHYIKADCGYFVYKYLEEMNDLERIVYFACTALMCYLMYKSGKLLTNLVHKQPAQRPPLKKTKQK